MNCYIFFLLFQLLLFLSYSDAQGFGFGVDTGFYDTPIIDEDVINAADYAVQEVNAYMIWIASTYNIYIYS